MSVPAVLSGHRQGTPRPRPPRGSRARRILHLPGRVLTAVLLGLLWGYQNLVSPLLGPRCRYYPSCSNYAVGALRTHGAAKGTALAVARVCRCHPWAAGGIDRVPPKGRWRADPDPTDGTAGGAAARTNCPAQPARTNPAGPAVPVHLPAASEPRL